MTFNLILVNYSLYVYIQCCTYSEINIFKPIKQYLLTSFIKLSSKSKTFSQKLLSPTPQQLKTF